MSRPALQRGTVVIVAMFIVALAATAASFSLQRQDLSVRALEVSRDYEQARWILRGGAHWARTILAEDARSSETDHAGELWAGGLEPTEVEGGSLAGRIQDQQGMFNLANLRRDGKPSERDMAAFVRLLVSLNLKVELAEKIAAAQPMSEVHELHRVPGCDERVVARLRPFVTILPQRTPVNVNTATPEVLSAVVDGLSLAEALVLAQSAKTQPMREVGEFRARLPRPDLTATGEDIAVRSRFFQVHGRALLGTASVQMEVLLQREGKALPVILWLRTS